jgi:hypothetical protein
MQNPEKLSTKVRSMTANFLLPVILVCVNLAGIGAISLYFFSKAKPAAVQPNIPIRTVEIPTAEYKPVIGTPPTAIESTAVGTQVIEESTLTPTLFSNVILKDDFSNQSSGWTHLKNADYTLEYKNGSYHILVVQPGDLHTASIGSKYTNVSVEVDAVETKGPDDGTIGVSCRVGANGSMYTFEYDQSGNYSIYKYDADGYYESLDYGTLDTNTVVQNGTNHIKGVCDGDTLTLILNNQVLSQVQDSDYSKGGVGLIVTSGSDGNMDVLFSHFLVQGP